MRRLLLVEVREVSHEVPKVLSQGVDVVVHALQRALHVPNPTHKSLVLLILDIVVSRWWHRRLLVWVLLELGVVPAVAGRASWDGTAPPQVVLALVVCSSSPSRVVLHLLSSCKNTSLVHLFLG